MDEPFSALDALTESPCVRNAGHVAGRRHACHTIVIVTHIIEEAVELADRVLVMGQGPEEWSDLKIDCPGAR